MRPVLRRPLLTSPLLTRRGLIAGLGGGLVAHALAPADAAAQVTDLRGLDSLWRTGEDQIRAFFGDVAYGAEGLEIDLPEFADVGSSVPITVRINAAMTEADYPKVLHLVAHKNPTQHIMSAWFRPESGKAEFSTRIRLEQTQMVTVVAEMSDGRHLRCDRNIGVSFGACGQIGTGSNDDIMSFKPQTRVSAPPVAVNGAVIPVRALISHPMETGLRLDGLEEWIRKRIISQFECTYNGVSVFRARLYPAIATNPYFQFYARAERSGSFDFIWYDMTDMTFRDRAPILVGQAGDNPNKSTAPMR